MSIIGNFFRNKWVRLTLILDLIVIIAIITIAIIQNNKSSVITFNITPIDAEISINGKKGYENGAYSFAPGTYEIKISHDSLEPKTFTIDLAPHYVSTISTFLAGPDNNFEFYELKDNYESYQLLEKIASADNNTTTDKDTSAEDFITEYQEHYTLWQNKLPFHYSDYQETDEGTELTKSITIKPGYDDACKRTLCIKVMMAHTDDKGFIEEILTDQKFNLESYDIIYENY